MSEERPDRRIVHAILALAILGGCAAIALDALRASQARAELRVAIAESRALDHALRLHRERNGAYPDSWESPGLDPRTFEPLRRRGYYDGAISSVLLDGRIDAYHSPDGARPNQEFWLEMTLARDPSIRLLIVDSDDAPLGGGRWLDGVYLYTSGRLDKI